MFPQVCKTIPLQGHWNSSGSSSYLRVKLWGASVLGLENVDLEGALNGYFYWEKMAVDYTNLGISEKTWSLVLATTGALKDDS